MKKLKQIIFEGLLHDGFGSEKRIIKYAVVIVLLSLTIVDYIVSRKIHYEVWLMWFGLIGYDGFRSTREKKNALPKDSKVTEVTTDKMESKTEEKTAVL